MADPIGMVEAAGLALMVAALIVGIGCRVASVSASVWRVAAVVVGFYLGCGWLGIVPRWPIREDLDRLLGLLIPSMLIVELASASPRSPRWRARGLRMGVAGLGAPLLLHGSAYLSGEGASAWTSSRIGVILGGIAAAEVAGWGLLSMLSRRGAGMSVSVAMATTIGAASVAIMLSGYLGGGQAGLPLSAAVLGAAIATAASRDPEAARSDATVGIAVVGLGSLLLIGHFFGGLRADHAAILAAAPMLAWAPEAPGPRRLRAPTRGVVRVVLVGMVAGGVVVDAARRFVEAEGPAIAAGAVASGDANP